jgi:hypothetical protein
MSRKTAKERVKAIYDCLAQNKKIKTISELSKILKVSSVVPRMLREKNVLMYNVSGKVVWNANIPYTLEMEEEIYAKTIEYSRQSETRRKEETLAEKARKEALEFYENEMSLQNIFDVLEENTAQDTAHDVEYKVSFVEHAIISLEVSVADLHRKVDALTTKLAELKIDGKIRPRVKLTPTPTTNTTKHNFFGEDL